MPPQAIPRKVLPMISIATFDAAVRRTHPMINGNMTKSIVFRRPMKLIANPAIKQITAAPTLSIELIIAHSVEIN